MTTAEPTILPAAQFTTDPKGWLILAAPGLSADGRCNLLAHAERGVVWGLLTEAGTSAAALLLSHEVFGSRAGAATLDPTLLWELRLFGPLGEVHLWHADGGWAVSVTRDGGRLDPTVIEERQMLWGDRVEDRRDGFTLMADGSEGLRHAPPVAVPGAAFAPRGKDKPARRPVRLVVRHYLEYDTYGNARIARSRLAGLEVIP